MITIACAQCGALAAKQAGAVNRAKKSGLRLFCSRTCAGLARRSGLTIKEKKARKAAYDVGYRARQGEARLEKKRAYHRRTYTYEKGLAFRQKRSAHYDHTEYCRAYFAADPARKAAKTDYDRKRLAALKYGPFAEAAMLLVDLEKEIRRREPDKYERAKARGYYERTAQQRKRNAGISKW